ncbi:DNA alkylation repair enzyme [Hyaloraphidium curvatum]|nr:DNA alkylation repair enzyme [Hyaloraphidium curvatum]
MSPWTSSLIRGLEASFVELGSSTKAAQMEKYMKNIAPFYGVQTPEMRKTVKFVLEDCGDPSPAELREAVSTLLAKPQRELHYASIEIAGKCWRSLAVTDLVPFAEEILTTKPWWDTVDAAGTALVTPMVKANPAFVEDMRRWLRSGDTWLARAAIQHQRGKKKETDVPLLVEFCHERAGDKEFWIAKAVGWALRDLAWIDAKAARKFVKDHPGLPPVAKREAERGLAGAGKPGAKRPGF